MIKIGITGGIGSGKSIVSHLLQIMGIPVYISDVRSKVLTVTDSQIRQQLIKILGEHVYCNDGQLNKSLLAEYLFSDPENAKKINNIIHPRVKEDFRQWAATHAYYPIVGIESAILIEAGFRSEIDKLIMVYAPLETRIKRTIQRDLSTEEAVRQRIKSQMDDEEKKRHADYIVINDGSSPVIPQLHNIIAKLQFRKSDS